MTMSSRTSAVFLIQLQQGIKPEDPRGFDRHNVLNREFPIGIFDFGDS